MSLSLLERPGELYLSNLFRAQLCQVGLFKALVSVTGGFRQQLLVPELEGLGWPQVDVVGRHGVEVDRRAGVDPIKKFSRVKYGLWFYYSIKIIFAPWPSQKCSFY